MEISALDISSDVGERPDDPQGLRDDLALLDVVSSANVACGGHAGDHISMRIICEAAVARGVAIGAQVSYLDREGFGRRRLDVTGEQLTLQVGEQWTDLHEAAEAAGAAIAYLRPHGALYNAALVDDAVAAAVLDAVPPRTPVLCLAGTALARLAEARGHPVTTEIFADRAVTEQGLLVPRTHPKAVIHDANEVERRLVSWIGTGRLHTLDGTPVSFEARSICIHSDTPGAVEAARRIRRVVERAGARVTPFVALGAGPERAAKAHERGQSMPAPAVHPYGEFSVLIDTRPGTAHVLAEWSRSRFGGQVRQAVPTADCLLLTFSSRVTSGDRARLEADLPAELVATRDANDVPAERAWSPLHTTPTGRSRPTRKPGSLPPLASHGPAEDTPPTVTIDVRYDGPDLHDVATRLGISAADVVALHSGATYRVAFFGFAPGFAYLTGLPEVLQLPRRDTPRTSVPAGAVAVASTYTAVYPRSSPGGWHLLGHTDATMFDPDRDPPTLLQPGDIVRFRAEE